MPAIIEHEAPFYMRRHGNTMLFGAFEGHEHVRLRDDWTFNGMPSGVIVNKYPVYTAFVSCRWQCTHRGTLRPHC